MDEYGSDWTHQTYDEGGVLPPGSMIAHNGSGKPIPVFTAEQAERGLAWLRDHYRGGTFRCPRGSEGSN